MSTYSKICTTAKKGYVVRERKQDSRSGGLLGLHTDKHYYNNNDSSTRNERRGCG